MPAVPPTASTVAQYVTPQFPQFSNKGDNNAAIPESVAVNAADAHG